MVFAGRDQGRSLWWSKGARQGGAQDQGRQGDPHLLQGSQALGGESFCVRLLFQRKIFQWRNRCPFSITFSFRTGAFFYRQGPVGHVTFRLFYWSVDLWPTAISFSTRSKNLRRCVKIGNQKRTLVYCPAAFGHFSPAPVKTDRAIRL